MDPIYRGHHPSIQSGGEPATKSGIVTRQEEIKLPSVLPSAPRRTDMSQKACSYLLELAGGDESSLNKKNLEELCTSTIPVYVQGILSCLRQGNL